MVRVRCLRLLASGFVPRFPVWRGSTGLPWRRFDRHVTVANATLCESVHGPIGYAVAEARAFRMLDVLGDGFVFGAHLDQRHTFSWDFTRTWHGSSPFR